MSSPLPGLRPLEPVPFDHGEERRIAWRDPSGLAQTIDVPQPVAVLMSLFDGQRSAEQVCAAWQSLSGEDLPAEFVDKLIAELDEHLVLDTPHFHAARAETLAQFRAQGVRRMAHAPDGYPADAAACAELFDTLLAQGRAEALSLRHGAVRGLIAPHIDLARGGPCYGAAYAALRDEPADLYIVFGTAHGSCCWPDPPPLATLTRLDYATPFGTLPTARGFIDDLCRRYAACGGEPDDLFRDELVHRGEHSVEFQTAFLHHLFSDHPVQVVPVLLGSLHEFFDQPEALEDGAGLGPLLDALAATIDAWPGRVCLIAGADLCHVGPRFGDREEVSTERVAEVATSDEQALALLSHHDPAAFFGHFAASANPLNVCSVANLYVLRALLPDAELELLRWQVAVDPQQTVSFAAAALR